MDLLFTATDCGISEVDDVLICTLSNARAAKGGPDEHYVTLQSWLDTEIDADALLLDPWTEAVPAATPGAVVGGLDLSRNSPRGRVYFEVDGPVNGGYGLVVSCAVTRARLTITLAYGVRDYPALNHVYVELKRLSDKKHDALVAALRRVFRERPEALEES